MATGGLILCVTLPKLPAHEWLLFVTNGMLTTNNPEYAELFRLLRQHGMSVNNRVRHLANRVIFEEYNVVGYNYRMTDI